MRDALLHHSERNARLTLNLSLLLGAPCSHSQYNPRPPKKRTGCNELHDESLRYQLSLELLSRDVERGERMEERREPFAALDFSKSSRRFEVGSGLIPFVPAPIPLCSLGRGNSSASSSVTVSHRVLESPTAGATCTFIGVELSDRSN